MWIRHNALHLPTPGRNLFETRSRRTTSPLQDPGDIIVGFNSSTRVCKIAMWFQRLLGIVWFQHQVSKTALESPSAQDLLDFFIKKVADIRKSTGSSDPMTRLPPSSSKFESFRMYTVDEVRRLMMSTKPKSCSLDPIPTSILFEFMDDLLPFITSMCNKSLLEGQLPLSQRHALVTPILKKDGLDATNVQNYRPISNLTYISKLVERMVCQQLTGFLNESGLLPKLQSGFRARHSTETATLRVLSDVLAAADRRGVTLLGLLDMSAAFDTVDHSILLQRTEVSFGLSGTVLSWLTSFLDGRTQQVVLNGAASSVEKITSGVPQGSVLGPHIFLLYTADIPLIAQAFGLGVHCYADDGWVLDEDREEMFSSVGVSIRNTTCWFSLRRALPCFAVSSFDSFRSSCPPLNLGSLSFDAPCVNLGFRLVRPSALSVRECRVLGSVDIGGRWLYRRDGSLDGVESSETQRGQDPIHLAG